MVHHDHLVARKHCDARRRIRAEDEISSPRQGPAAEVESVQIGAGHAQDGRAEVVPLGLLVLPNEIAVDQGP